jgi:hypothetical protein
MSRRFGNFENFAEQYDIKLHEGPQLRELPTDKKNNETIEYVPEFWGKYIIDIKKLKNLKHVFVLPLEPIPRVKCYIREQSKSGIKVCEPPHIFVDVSRRFAIYSDDYFVIPPRQLGVAGKNSTLLKALALYFCSDFFRYHQFFLAPQWGIDRSITILDTLKQLPIPPNIEKHAQEWAKIYEQLQDNAISTKYSLEKQNELFQKANEHINRALGLRISEVILISDFLEYKLKLIDNANNKELIDSCNNKELDGYSKTLEESMNNFFDKEDGIYHRVVVLDEKTLPDNMRGIRIDSFKDNENRTPTQIKLPENIRDILLRKHSQWIYFQRELRYYEKRSIFLFKPNEKLHWLRSQALIDADNIIGEILSVKGYYK